MSKTRGVSIGIWGLALAALAIVVPIIWDWWKQSSGVTVEVVSSTSVFSVQNPIGGLDFSYRGKRVDYLSQVVLRVKNSGRSPILRGDVVSPLTISVGGELFEGRVTDSSPANLGATVVLQGREVLIDFPLLNPGDGFVVTVLTPERDPVVEAVARIKGVSGVDIVLPAKRSGYQKLDTIIAVVAVGLIALLFTSFTVIGFFQWIKKRKFVASLLEGGRQFREVASSDDALGMLLKKGQLDFLGDPAKRELVELFNCTEWPLAEGSLNEFLERVRGVVKGNVIFPVVIFSAVVAVPSIYYCWTRVYFLFG
ncbi:MAG: hypothetical protein ACN6RG_02120 [Stenotrophomonas sp.]